MTKTKKKLKAAIYARISSRANTDGAGLGRQKNACRKTGSDMKVNVVHSVAEIVSGSLPLEQRASFKQLLEKCKHEGIEHIIVEGSRAIARNAIAAEEVYQRSSEAKKLGSKSQHATLVLHPKCQPSTEIAPTGHFRIHRTRERHDRCPPPG